MIRPILTEILTVKVGICTKTVPRQESVNGIVMANIHEEFLRPNLGRFLENVPNWDVFEKKSILTEVRVSVDSHGPGDHGLGAGLVV